MRESKIEKHLRLQVLKHGGMCKKLRNRNDPDRLVLWPGGNAVFVELKATGKGARASQAREHKRLRDRGYPVEVLNSLVLVDRFIAFWTRQIAVVEFNPEFDVQPAGKKKAKAK